MNIISVLNPKGGSGKTTLAVHLADALRRTDRTLLVDSDIQGSARDWRAAGDSPLPVIGIDRPSLDKDVLSVGSDYEWVVIDGASKLEKMVAAAVKASDLILIPIQPSPLDIWACASLVEVIQTRQKVTDGTPVAAFVLTRVKKNTVLARDAIRAIQEFGLPLFQGSIHDRTLLARSLANGQTVLDIEPNGEAAWEIRHLEKQVREAFSG